MIFKLGQTGFRVETFFRLEGHLQRFGFCIDRIGVDAIDFGQCVSNRALTSASSHFRNIQRYHLESAAGSRS